MTTTRKDRYCSVATEQLPSNSAVLLSPSLRSAMRILHIAQSVSGGIASYLEEIAGFQIRQFGMGAVRFLIPAGNRHHVPSIERTEIAEFNPCDRSGRGLLALGLATHREIKNFAPTIVHLHSTFAGAVARPVVLLSRRKPRVVYCAHGWAFAMEVPLWKRKLFSLIERSLVPLTDTIINISHSEYQLACSNGIRPEKMVCILNGIAAAPPLGPRARIEIQQNSVNLIFVGRHDRQKGLDYLLDVLAAADVPGVHLHVVGAPVLERFNGVSAASTPSNVTFYGWQTREAVSNMIACADALIMPSRWEGFGLAALEAMRLGKPVLASRRGALTEIVEHGRTGLLFDLDRPSELPDILRGLDKRTLVEMGKAAHNEFLRSFTSDRLNAELAALYRSLLENQPRIVPVGSAKKQAPEVVATEVLGMTNRERQASGISELLHAARTSGSTPDCKSEESALLPTLIIAGAPKSGTSSVFRWLADHPDVLGSTVKETYYFVDPGTHMFDSAKHFLSGGIEGYRQFFPRGDKLPRLVVEATPSYLYSELAIRELPRIPSRPHFIFLLRDPVSQIHSIFRYFQSNWDWIAANLSFPEFLAASGTGTYQFRGNELAQYALRNAAYVDFLLRWREACGADRLHVFLFEEAFSDKRRFMRRLAEQFGIDAGFYDTYNFPPENQTYSVRSKALQKLNISVRSWLPQGAFYKAARSVYRHVNTRIEAAEERLDEELEITLAERYQQANERLADEFNLSLKAWTEIQESRRARQRQKAERQHVTG